MKSAITNYIKLTKPTIVLLFSLTGAGAMVLEGSLLKSPWKFLLILVGITLTAASANALNMYVDRDIDEIMQRTRKKRPLPQGKISPQKALYFGLILGAVSTGILLITSNVLATLISIGTILFYVCFYTLYLKRRTPYNIVIGGAAGATAPLIGWAAASGQISLAAWLMFLIIFMWTPPHFWALALVIKEDYKKAGIPMLPVVAGDRRTRLEILIYTVLLLPLPLLPPLTNLTNATYVTGSIVLGGIFLFLAMLLWRKKTNSSAYGLFGYSIFYLLVLFVLLIVGAGCTHHPSATKSIAPATLELSEFDKKFNSLEVGLEKGQVKEKLGEPSLREVIQGIEIWHYTAQQTQSDSKKIEFQNGKVSGFSKELPPPSKAEMLPETNRNIGDRCESDTQCSSANCHFSICSGKNNCHRTVGQLCATDNDCCFSRCDFGKCKKP
jgi:protoheme IX farnesyltransferase